MCLSKGTVCRRRLLLFLLAGLLLCLLRFLSHVALRDPKVGSMQVDLDMHKYRVHHNCKIDTARFEEGKRPSHSRNLRSDEALTWCVDTARFDGSRREEVLMWSVDEADWHYKVANYWVAIDLVVFGATFSSARRTNPTSLPHEHFRQHPA